MNKFEKTLGELEEKFIEIKEISIVILYGSIARGDYSLRHSDMDLFIILNKINEKIISRINDKLLPIGSRNGVKVHIEYQGMKIKEKDHTLIEKMIEEGNVIYSNAFMVFPTDKIGLKQYIVYEFSSDKPAIKTRISQILHGRKSWYFKDKKKIVKTYKGIADNKEIILVGKGAVMVSKDKQKDIISMFERLGVEYKIKKIVYG
jgi:predicted nucleotidyltransferase